MARGGRLTCNGATDGTLDFAALRQLEAWLLSDAVQAAGGDHDGAVAGWVDEAGAAGFLYPEITGYYLTWLSFLRASRPEFEHEAAQRSARAVSWLARIAEEPLLPTRIYLRRNGTVDWRSAAVFSFDVAMVLRGVAQATSCVGGPALALLNSLGARFGHWFAEGTDILRSHRPPEADLSLPRRWSTEPGVHHAKAAAAILLLPDGAVASSVRTVSAKTVDHWASSGGAFTPAQKALHPELYFIEGLLLAAYPGRDTSLLPRASAQYQAVMAGQRSDGALPPDLDRPRAAVRADVLAQALRVGCLLLNPDAPGRDGRLNGLTRLAAALEMFVTSAGSVVFERESGRRYQNTWAAMFAHQALSYLQAVTAHGVVPDAWASALV
jgi:hypothetical protein